MTADPTTLAALKAWMAERCYNGAHYNLDGGTAAEGFGIARDGGGWVWYFTERGSFRPESRFASEAAIVAHAFGHIRSNASARWHLVGFVADRLEMERLIAAAKARGVACHWDKVPWKADDPRYRVFVTGCDIRSVGDLIRRDP